VTSPWYSEIWRIALLLAAGWLLGHFVGSPSWGLVAALLAYVLWQLLNLQKLYAWLADARNSETPSSGGAWGTVFYRLQRLDAKHQEERRASQDLLERYKLATRALPEATVTLGAGGEIELINDAAGRLLGLKDPEDLGRPITNLIRIPDFVEFMGKRDYRETLDLPTPVVDGIALSVRVVELNEIGKRLLLARDISRVRKLEQVRRDFIANVSHEMKSPLTVIKGYAESLLDDCSEHTVKWRKPLTQINQQTVRLCEIVEDLLQLSNLETSPDNKALAPVDMPALVSALLEEAIELSKGRHQLDSDVDKELFLLGSFNELYSAFSNIVFNAVRYTPTGGRVEVRWYRDTAGGARFEVSDTGPGIAA
jgi:two-component system phosphate regulon sensor histidine kinase PhoR